MITAHNEKPHNGHSVPPAGANYMWRHRARYHKELLAFLDRKLERTRRTVTAIFGPPDEDETG